MDFDFIMLMWILQPSNSSTDTLVEPDTGDDVQIKGTTVNAIAMFHYNEGFTEVYSNLTLTPTQELNNMSVTCKLSDSDAETVILTVIGKMESHLFHVMCLTIILIRKLESHILHYMCAGF